MFSFLKKGATIVIKQAAKVAITPTTSNLPHEPSVGKMIKNLFPTKSREKHFDLKMHNRTYNKLGIELPSSTRAPGHQDEVALRVPSYKIPFQTIQKFATWQEQGKEGDVEETKSGIAESILNPLSAAEEAINSKSTDKHFLQLKELDKKLEEIGGKIIVESTQGSYKQNLTIEIDVSDKSLQEIQEQVRLVLHGLDIHDEKLIQTFSERLYKSSNNQKVTSADIEEKKHDKPNTDTQEKTKHHAQGESVVAPSQEHEADHDILSSDFSLTNPCSMPYAKSSVQSADALLEQQHQTLMQQKSDHKVLNSISPEVQKTIEQIAEDLQDEVQINDQIQSNIGNKRAPNTPGKAHAR
ncbi:hypothetical protein K6025_02135 [Ehrlichia sp. JZT12]